MHGLTLPQALVFGILFITLLSGGIAWAWSKRRNDSAGESADPDECRSGWED